MDDGQLVVLEDERPHTRVEGVGDDLQLGLDAGHHQVDVVAPAQVRAQRGQAAGRRGEGQDGGGGGGHQGQPTQGHVVYQAARKKKGRR